MLVDVVINAAEKVVLHLGQIIAANFVAACIGLMSGIVIGLMQL